MDLSAISSIGGFDLLGGVGSIDTEKLAGAVTGTAKKTDGTLFESFLNTAIENVNTTNSYLSDAENEEIKFALGETENTHDLTIALQKASTALQYTVAVRDKVIEAYRELMQMQI